MTKLYLWRTARKIPRETLAAKLRIPDIILRYLEQGLLQPTEQHRARFRSAFGSEGERLLEAADIVAAFGSDGAALLADLNARLDAAGPTS